MKEIAASTKISLKFLKALEDDQPEMLPGRFFVKGILRSYSRAIGLDEDYVLNKYQEDQLLREEARGPSRRTAAGRFRFKTKFVLPLIVTIFILGLIVFSLIYIARPQGVAQSAQTAKAVAPAPAQVVPPPPQLQEAATPEPKDLALALSFTQETWVQVYADGALVLDGLKRTGDTVSLRAGREFVFNLGNAGGMAYTLNGRKGKPLGAPGEVVRDIRITLEDYQNFVLPETENEPAQAEKRR